MGNDSIVVLKFGGSVLERDDSLRQVCSAVSRAVKNKNSVIVVVSAMKGVTDRLLSIAREIDPSMEPAMLDEILSTGERTAAKKVTDELRKSGINAFLLEPGNDSWPIITNSRHLDADPLIEETRERIMSNVLPLLKKGYTVVIPGFIGQTKAGKITTLGRGGSDTTAVLVASMVGAKEAILVKDVDGIYSSDPDVIDSPVLLEKVGLHEAEILSETGGKFIHSKALRYMNGRTRVRITSMSNLEKGTLIESDMPDLDVSVTERNVRMLSVILNEEIDPQTMGNVIELIKHRSGAIVSISQLDNSLIVYFKCSNDISNEIHDALVKSGRAKAVSIYDGLSMISIRGNSLETRSGLIQKVTQPLARKGMNIFGITTIFSSIRLFVSSNIAENAAEEIKNALLVRRT